MYKRVKRICQYCGKEFEVQEWVVKKGGGKFCSHMCYLKYKQKKVEKEICLNCGKEFEVESYEKGKRKFCSYECHWKYMTKRVKKICEVCGKEFEVPLSAKNRKFCSNQCCKEYKKSREYRSKLSKKQSEIMKTLWRDSEFRRKMSEARNMLWRDSEFRKKMSEIRRMLWKDPELRKRRSEKMKMVWQDPEYREKTIKSIIAGTELKPNGLEKIFCDLLQSYFLQEWRYVGDGKVFIAGFVPDFIHKEEDWIIELNGDYWHSFPENREKDERKKEKYEKCGYKVLEIWESEFRSDPMAVVDKIVEAFY
jgi:very-short-patch-repair endonuclease